MDHFYLANSRHLVRRSISSIDNWPMAASDLLVKLNSLSSAQVSNRDVFIHFEGDEVHVSRVFTGFLNVSDDNNYEVVDYTACEAQRLVLQIGDIYDKREKIEEKITNAGLSLEEGLKYWLRISFKESKRILTLEYFGN